jgi:hypothetical protein
VGPIRRIGLGVLSLLAACDPRAPAVSTEHAWAARSGAVPQPGPSAVCEPQIPVLEPIATIELDPFDDLTWLRRVHDLVALDATRMLAVGTWGDWFDEGAFVIALGPDGDVAWTRLPTVADDPILGPHIEPLDDGSAWVIAGLPQATQAFRYDADGTELAAVLVDGLRVLDAWAPTPSGGLWLVGRDDMAAPVRAELAADGTVLWQGPDDLAAFDRALADGVVRRLDAAGALAWEHDPRPEPFAGFPLDRGATWARLHAAGDVAAVGTVVGEAGDATLLLRLDAAGDPRWSQVWPRVRVTTSHPRPDGSLLVLGEARECWPRRWMALVDAEGTTLAQAQIDSTYPLLALDGADRPVSLLANGDVLELHTYPEVMR